jgi:dihydropyrimidinase
MIVHVSNGEAMEEIRRARGLKIYGETCPRTSRSPRRTLKG